MGRAVNDSNIIINYLQQKFCLCLGSQQLARSLRPWWTVGVSRSPEKSLRRFPWGYFPILHHVNLICRCIKCDRRGIGPNRHGGQLSLSPQTRRAKTHDC